MKYATWKLKFDNPKYGYGPQVVALNLGVQLEGAYLVGYPSGGTILGYVFGDAAPDNFADFEYKEITQGEALNFVQDIDPTAYVDTTGRIMVETVGE
jgi:hypothetical protein